MRAFLLQHATPDTIPCHRAEGLGASLTLHLAVALALVNMPPSPTGGTAPTLAVTFVSESELASNAAPASEDAAPPIAETPATGPDAGGTITGVPLSLPDFAFDISKVGEAEDLFPFLTDPLIFLDEAREKFSPARDRLLNPFGRERKVSAYPPLEASEAERQAIVDRAWSRRDRWTNFAEIAGLLTTHDPQDGSAYLLMRQYLDDNLLQPYYDSRSRDPRFWVMLGLAADHKALIEFVGSFVRRNPSSRTTTELLFMLDEFAQASRDTLLMLLSTDPRSQLDDTRDASISAWEVAVRLHRRYDNAARDRGLRETKSIRNYFDEVRLHILKTIIETTPDGYGATDARFLAGRILWDQNKMPGALEWWRELEPDGRNAYREAAAAIAVELRFRDGGTSGTISRILGSEYRRWLTFSEQRLAQFGYEFDTF